MSSTSLLQGLSGPGALSGVGGTLGGIFSLIDAETRTIPTLKAIGRREASEYRRLGREIGAKQTVGYAKAGVRTDVGTPVHVAASTAARAELAALDALFARESQIRELRQTEAARIFSSALTTGVGLVGGFL